MAVWDKRKSQDTQILVGKEKKDAHANIKTIGAAFRQQGRKSFVLKFRHVNFFLNLSTWLALSRAGSATGASELDLLSVDFVLSVNL